MTVLRDDDAIMNRPFRSRHNRLRHDWSSLADAQQKHAIELFPRYARQVLADSISSVGSPQCSPEDRDSVTAEFAFFSTHAG